ATKHSARPRRSATRRLYGDDEGQGFSCRHRQGPDGNQSGLRRPGAGPGERNLLNTAGDREEGGFLPAIERFATLSENLEFQWMTRSRTTPAGSPTSSST